MMEASAHSSIRPIHVIFYHFLSYARERSNFASIDILQMIRVQLCRKKVRSGFFPRGKVILYH